MAGLFGRLFGVGHSRAPMVSANFAELMEPGLRQIAMEQRQQAGPGLAAQALGGLGAGLGAATAGMRDRLAMEAFNGAFGPTPFGMSVPIYHGKDVSKYRKKGKQEKELFVKMEAKAYA